MRLSDLKQPGDSNVSFGDPVEEEAVVASDSVEAAEQPVGVAQVVTPSGLEIYYQAAPKRLYRVRERGWDGPNFSDWLDWVEVPSVSTILDVLEKGGLSWWGMKVGVEGVKALIANSPDPDMAEWWMQSLLDQHVDWWIERLKEHKLTVNHVKDQAASRGTNVHTALELYADSGVIPDPELYPENEAGYVRGLVAFLQDANPTIHRSELMVASTRGYAGRFDAVANLDFAGKVVTKCYPKREGKREEVSGTWLLDLKTSKGVYPSYKLQVAAYRAAMVECGYEAVDHIGVVRVTADGKYELVESHATIEDFLAVLEVYHAVKRLS